MYKNLLKETIECLNENGKQKEFLSINIFIDIKSPSLRNSILSYI